MSRQGCPFGSGLVFVSGCPECPIALKSLAVYDACPQLRKPIVLRQRVHPAISMFSDHPSEQSSVVAGGDFL